MWLRVCRQIVTNKWQEVWMFNKNQQKRQVQVINKKSVFGKRCSTVPFVSWFMEQGTWAKQCSAYGDAWWRWCLCIYHETPRDLEVSVKTINPPSVFLPNFSAFLLLTPLFLSISSFNQCWSPLTAIRWGTSRTISILPGFLRCQLPVLMFSITRKLILLRASICSPTQTKPTALSYAANYTAITRELQVISLF